MARRDDAEDKTYFRSHRLFCCNGEWFFVTREGEQGPYPDRDRADAALKLFIGEIVDLKHFQDTREAGIIDADRLTLIEDRVDEDGKEIEVRKFATDADLLI